MQPRSPWHLPLQIHRHAGQQGRLPAATSAVALAPDGDHLRLGRHAALHVLARHAELEAHVVLLCRGFNCWVSTLLNKRSRIITFRIPGWPKFGGRTWPNSGQSCRSPANLGACPHSGRWRSCALHLVCGVLPIGCTTMSGTRASVAPTASTTIFGLCPSGWSPASLTIATPEHR